ncbi:serine/threonine protein kinase [Streptomyces sulfonofaciens]|uniref:non-specific serine/threonine protein kinase n=1 Tax=Streptomyces sulfonofaciens TaxID=68272 RepID=A0A919G664_9ACTN|nr:serine/threonine-protein kinase [Streptomyces sulfonofaciens]GHH78710.1 serine/threonine protein kinase [Streptomyces sulfonofaciens]
MQGLLLAGRYRLGETIGRGGMGRVWRAHDELLHRAVAVKELTAAQYVSEADRTVMLARTQTEARAAARINHPAVVTIHDVLEHDDRPWIVMELVEGGSLADAVKESGGLEPRYAARVGLWVLRALRAAHAAGVLHRDVKPGNVLLATDGRVLLTDFGIAQMEGDTTLTKTGEVVGSVDYLAPERVRGADPGHASDLWALGATLYTAVDGRSPFRRTTPLATMQAVVEEEMPPPAGGGPLGPVIAALLRKDPDARPGAEDAEAMLLEASEGRSPAAAQEYLATTAHPYGPPEPHGTPQPQGAVQPPGAPHPQEDPTRDYRSVREGHPHDASGGQRYGPYPSYGAHGPSGAGTGGQGRYGPGPQPELMTSTQPPAAHSAPPLTPTPSAARGRRGWNVVAIVVAAAALVGGGTALGLHYAEGHGQAASLPSHTAPAPAPSVSPPHSAGPTHRAGEIPADWKRVDDVEGFSLMLPQGWQREANGTQVDYTPDHGNHFVRISVDHAPDWDNPYMHQLDLEKQLRDLPDYRRGELTQNSFRDQPGSLWEFRWTAVPDDSFPGPRHAIEQTYVDGAGTEYAIYMSSPADDWATTREQFDIVLRGWRPGDSGSMAGSNGSDDSEDDGGNGDGGGDE